MIGTLISFVVQTTLKEKTYLLYTRLYPISSTTRLIHRYIYHASTSLLIWLVASDIRRRTRQSAAVASDKHIPAEILHSGRLNSITDKQPGYVPRVKP
jgi:hypothetical protein